VKTDPESHYPRDYHSYDVTWPPSKNNEADGRDGIRGGQEQANATNADQKKWFPLVWFAAFKKFDVRDKIASLALGVSSLGAVISAGAVFVAVMVFKDNSNKTRLEQRAWVGLSEPQVVGDCMSAAPFKVTAKIKNSGRTPAKEVVITSDFEYGPTWFLERALSQFEKGTGNKIGIVAPGIDFVRQMDVNPAGRLARAKADFPNERIFFVLYFRVTYNDQFGTETRTTAFVGYRFSGDDGAVALAPFGHRMD
jgi:hypothetical protein